ncbi:hypothetical protein GCM10010104_23920 [Streptomyces indiaensis]|uniref:Uncharacterized protein n=1 Tax=Streptomyces indiaensis TaxID=284033 RepID=A0ABP5QA28_9ACTN
MLSEAEVAQINSYAYAVTTDERYHRDDQTRWEFWLVGNSIDDVVPWQHPGGYVRDDGRVTIRIITWGAIIDACEERLRKQRERLNCASDQTRSIEHAQGVHAYTDVVPLTGRGQRMRRPRPESLTGTRAGSRLGGGRAEGERSRRPWDWRWQR